MPIKREGRFNLKTAQLIEGLEFQDKTLGDWLAQSAPAPALRECAITLSGGLEDHARREEQLFFKPLSTKSSNARNWVDMMEIMHDEVRGLF